MYVYIYVCYGQADNKDNWDEQEGVWSSRSLTSPNSFTPEDIINWDPTSIVAHQALLLRSCSNLMSQNAVQCCADFIFILSQLVVVAERVVPAKLNTVVVLVVVEVASGVGDNLQEAIQWGFNPFVHPFASILLSVGHEEIRNFPNISSSTNNGISDHFIEISSCHRPFTDDVSTYVCMYVYIYICMYVCMCVYINTYVCKYVYIYVCMYVYTAQHIYGQRPLWGLHFHMFRGIFYFQYFYIYIYLQHINQYIYIYCLKRKQ